jgi:hypothetical protein
MPTSLNITIATTEVISDTDKIRISQIYGKYNYRMNRGQMHRLSNTKIYLDIFQDE